MTNYLFVSALSGIIFGVLDGLIHANPYAQRLFAVYEPIAKKSINAPLGMAIDLVYGLVMTGLFLTLYKSLPGQTGLVKGLSFGLIVWFFRVAMYTLTQLMMFEVPMNTLAYTLTTGLAEMVIVGAVIGLTLKV
jgi:hypothetical protein